MDLCKETKKRLIDMDKNYNWLAHEVEVKTSMFCDASTLSRVIRGERDKPKIKEAVCSILGITED